ncbi:PepSY domain-containing protein [Nocardia higoensis]|uniref:PepSY domain-containing protein n=1 Tax=Nocardia higoensis TaxID=228599 RepID=A0ABS0D9B3_9NOCA|nr:PepSY domain-containing protein [Nocardia higoensis]
MSGPDSTPDPTSPAEPHLPATAAGTGATDSRRESRAEPNSGRRGVQALAMRLHFYAGVFVAPFILVAAVTGALYAISPTLEQFVSRDLLTVDQTGAPRPLAEQIDAATALRPDLALVAVSPAPGATDTTRVIFADPALGESERHAVFVDPYTAEPIGESVVYGSSGALPLRTWIDRLHRDLHLGEPGRLYSELAASWLWIVALAGLALWWRRVRTRRSRSSSAWLLAPDRSRGGRLRNMNWHGAIGMWILPLAALLSVTGMTWSTYAGANIGDLRAQLSWTTPAVSTSLGEGAPAAGPSGDHQHHGGGHVGGASADSGSRAQEIDRAYAAARAAGITQAAEITVPQKADRAYAVKERRLPGIYTVDSVAVDGRNGAITDRLDYADWPLMAKLTNWGIQFHMGLMFGLANQLLLLAAMIGLVVVIVLGYRMWWQRRPTRDAGRFAFGRAPRRGALRGSSLWLVLPLLAATVVVGWFVPLVGLSLLGFLVIDTLIGLRQRFGAAAS